jgi:S-DNA-T family DNA segregation ATPase FtsK/SpoIIIE
LARGVKVSKVTSLEDDLAMALKAKSIRIVAPIPGKGTIGIEIPNSNPSVVYLKSIISSEKFIKHKSKLAIAMGKMINGENYILDLAKTPHLLIAGSTGSGKSVCVNGLIISILYRATPEEVQFCMIDPKKVELSVYSDLVKHHLLKIEGIDDAVVTSPEDAVRLLEALVTEMENRYELLQKSGTRNLEEYNTMIEGGELRANEKGEPYKKLPYIVCILDEYADLMMTSGKAVEDPICRLAQMARAIGIHLVLATQRPSVKVVTGAIKANFPTRIAFRVISQIDSRTILDCKGADSLLGKGDMLIIPPGESDLVRIQNALVETKEINKVVKHIAAQPDNFDKISIKAKPSSAQIAAMNGDDDFAGSGDRDALYQDAKRLVIRTGMASVSMLQRGLSVGYARAGGLIDQLERDGIVGPHQGSKPREVLVSSEGDD